MINEENKKIENNETVMGGGEGNTSPSTPQSDKKKVNIKLIIAIVVLVIVIVLLIIVLKNTFFSKNKQTNEVPVEEKVVLTPEEQEKISNDIISKSELLLGVTFEDNYVSTINLESNDKYRLQLLFNKLNNKQKLYFAIISMFNNDECSIYDSGSEEYIAEEYEQLDEEIKDLLKDKYCINIVDESKASENLKYLFNIDMPLDDNIELYKDVSSDDSTCGILKYSSNLNKYFWLSNCDNSGNMMINYNISHTTVDSDYGYVYINIGLTSISRIGKGTSLDGKIIEEDADFAVNYMKYPLYKMTFKNDGSGNYSFVSFELSK